MAITAKIIFVTTPTSTFRLVKKWRPETIIIGEAAQMTEIASTSAAWSTARNFSSNRIVQEYIAQEIMETSLEVVNQRNIQKKINRISHVHSLSVSIFSLTISTLPVRIIILYNNELNIWKRMRSEAQIKAKPYRQFIYRHYIREFAIMEPKHSGFRKDITE